MEAFFFLALNISFIFALRPRGLVTATRLRPALRSPTDTGIPTMTRAGQGRLCDDWYYFYILFCPKIGLHKNDKMDNKCKVISGLGRRS